MRYTLFAGLAVAALALPGAALAGDQYVDSHRLCA